MANLIRYELTGFSKLRGFILSKSDLKRCRQTVKFNVNLIKKEEQQFINRSTKDSISLKIHLKSEIGPKFVRMYNLIVLHMTLQQIIKQRFRSKLYKQKLQEAISQKIEDLIFLWKV